MTFFLADRPTDRPPTEETGGGGFDVPSPLALRAVAVCIYRVPLLYVPTR